MRAALMLCIFVLGTVACQPEVMTTSGGDPVAGTKKKAEPADKKANPLPAGLISVNLSGEQLPANAPKVEEARGWLEASLLGEPEFKAPVKGEASSATATLRGTYRASHQPAKDDSGQILGVVFFKLKLKLKGAGGGELSTAQTEAFIGEALAEGKDPDAALVELVKSVAGEVAGELARQLRAEHATDTQLVGFLAARDDLSLLKATIPQIRHRRVKGAGPGLVALLTHKERDIVNIAASTLGDVGTRDAVPALIDCGSRAEPADRLPVLYALGKLGGPQAILYLETLAKDMDHPLVKRAAEEALKEAKRGPK